MFSLVSAKNRNLLGLDISSTGVKLVQLSPLGNRWRLDNYAIRSVPEGAILSDKADRSAVDTAMLAECLQQAVSLLRLRRREVAVAVAGSAVITRLIELPASLTDAEMENQIIVEADQYIPYPLEEVALDFERQGEVNAATGTVEVFLAACRRDTVEDYVAVIEAAGLIPNIVDIEAFAMERACSLLFSVDEPVPPLLAVVDIGAATITLHVLRYGRWLFTREQAFGGRQLLEQVRQRYGLSAAEAEAGIRRGELPDDYAQQLVPRFREDVADQINRALQFFFSSTVHNQVDALVLAGGVAPLSGLAAAVAEETGISTRLANPFAAQSMGERVNATLLNNDAPALMVACGLAMRSRY